MVCLIPWQWWQTVAYVATVVIIVEQTRLVAVPLAMVTVCLLGLALGRRWPDRRVAILRSTIVLLAVIWVTLKYTCPREFLSAALSLHGGFVLPVVIGVSYLFIKLTHVCVDSMRPNAPRVKPLTLLAMSMFPATYEAGPMHRYSEFAESFENPRSFLQRDWMKVARRIIWGLFKTTLLGARLQVLCLPQLTDPGAVSMPRLWLAMYAYAFYIYFNFSGMSDLAIGIGEAFGIKVPENFASPYLKRDIQQFWQSWHITLTRWLQAYLFMPISRRLMKTPLRRRPKLVAWIGYFITFGFCGVWHGEAAHFLVWGLYHAAGLGLYASLPARWKAPTGEAAQATSWRSLVWWFVTFQFVSFGWLLFACNLPDAALIVRRMFGAG